MQTAPSQKLVALSDTYPFVEEYLIQGVGILIIKQEVWWQNRIPNFERFRGIPEVCLECLFSGNKVNNNRHHTRLEIRNS